MAAAEEDGKAPFHVFHKVPAGDGLYVRAKHAQLVERNPEKAIALFLASLEARDRVDSALKDLAIVLKQQGRPHDAILAISAFRACCSESAQDSLDNVLLDLYKSSGRLDDQIALLIHKLRAFQNTCSFNGKRTKTARSQGKKFQVSVEQEIARLLGNLGWAYMQQSNYQDAESAYRRALALEVDINKMCNLGVCLMKQGRPAEAIAVLKEASFVKNSKKANSDSHWKSYERATELICQASTMLRSNGDLDHANATSGDTCLRRLDEGGRLLGEVDRALDYTEDLSAHRDACYDTGGIVGADACSHHDTTTVKDVDKINEDGIFACDGDGTINCQPAEECADSFLNATLLSSSLLRSQMRARRRLPVFWDITIIGSAAA